MQRRVFTARLLNNSKVSRSLVTLLILLLTACSSWPWQQRLPELPLLPPAALGQQWQLTQSVTFTPLNPKAKAQAHTLLAAWSVDDQRLDLAGLTLAGQTLLTLSYDGQEFNNDRSPLLPPEVSPRDILTQLQLAYWPLDSFDQALSHSQWRLEQHGNVRQLYWQQRLVITLTRSPHAAVNTSVGHNRESALESFTLIHHLLQIQLRIQTLTRENLPSGKS
jgi:hypothetical protein